MHCTRACRASASTASTPCWLVAAWQSTLMELFRHCSCLVAVSLGQEDPLGRPAESAGMLCSRCSCHAQGEAPATLRAGLAQAQGLAATECTSSEQQRSHRQSAALGGGSRCSLLRSTALAASTPHVSAAKATAVLWACMLSMACTSLGSAGHALAESCRLPSCSPDIRQSTCSTETVSTC